ncbi:MAG TPA: hypothetical protein VGK47_05925 [Nitrososphaeraceae archaeon]
MSTLDSKKYKEAERQSWDSVAIIGKSGGRRLREVLKKLVGG